MSSNIFESPDKGSEITVYLAVSPDIKSITGWYFEDGKPPQTSEITYNREIAGKLWEMTEGMLGQ